MLVASRSSKTINEEVDFLLRLMGDIGDVLRVRLPKKKQLKLKVRNRVGKAYDPVEKARLLATAKQARSPHIYPALKLAMNTGMRPAVRSTAPSCTWLLDEARRKPARVALFR